MLESVVRCNARVSMEAARVQLDACRLRLGAALSSWQQHSTHHHLAWADEVARQ